GSAPGPGRDRGITDGTDQRRKAGPISSKSPWRRRPRLAPGLFGSYASTSSDCRCISSSCQAGGMSAGTSNLGDLGGAFALKGIPTNFSYWLLAIVSIVPCISDCLMALGSIKYKFHRHRLAS